MTTTSSQKWYDNRLLLIFLFFILPPLGAYGMIRHKTDTTKKVIYLVPACFFSLVFVGAIIGAIFTDNYKSGIDYYNKKEYTKAYDNLMQVSPDDKNYKDAIAKITEIRPIVDSIKKSEELLKASADAGTEKNSPVGDKSTQAQSETKKGLKSQLERELASVSDGVKIAEGENISALQMDLVLFNVYWTIIHEGEASADPETKKLATQLKSKVVDLQAKGFPMLRKKYTEFAKNLLWEHDIDVYATGSGKTLNLTAGIFAANKNIKDTEETIAENMTLFRFKQVRYRWYKGDDEFTYYDINPPKDTEPVVFVK